MSETLREVIYALIPLVGCGVSIVGCVIAALYVFLED